MNFKIIRFAYSDYKFCLMRSWDMHPVAGYLLRLQTTSSRLQLLKFFRLVLNIQCRFRLLVEFLCFRSPSYEAFLFERHRMNVLKFCQERHGRCFWATQNMNMRRLRILLKDQGRIRCLFYIKFAQLRRLLDRLHPQRLLCILDSEHSRCECFFLLLLELNNLLLFLKNFKDLLFQQFLHFCSH